MSISPNPWDPESSDLPDVNSKESEKILDDIRYFLRRWPGNLTSLLDDEERHYRLVRVIAGYPMIMDGLTPWDAPFEKDSVRCFSMILALDNKKSEFDSCGSLWTELLEVDWQFSQTEGWSYMEYGYGELKDRRTEQLLASLFLGLGEPIPKSKKDIPKLSRAAQSLLAEIFTYARLPNWYKVCNFMREPSGSMKLKDNSEFGFLTYEYKRIKNWIHDINPDMSRGQSLSQRYIRGASSLLQIGMGLLRSGEWGKGRKSSNILVDGGGRLVSKLPVDSNGKFTMRATGYEALIDNGVTRSGYLLDELYGLNILDFRTDLRTPNVSDAPWEEVMAEIGPYLGRFVMTKPDYFWKQKSGNMLVVDSLNRPRPESLDPGEIELREPLRMEGTFAATRASEQAGKKEYDTTRVIPPWSEACPRCNPKLPITSKEARLIEKKEGGFCWQHRMLHEIGHRQRIRDSGQNQPDYDKDNPDIKIPFPPRQRQVNAIANIDGNSIGWLLRTSRFNEELEDAIDGMRRRSMRFNAHWWISLSEAIAKQNREVPDSIACWVGAGDDIVLAVYGGEDEEVSDSLDLLKGMLEEFSKNLNGSLNIELTADSLGPLATFCASISHRLGGGISGMYTAASDLEIVAKARWREKHQDMGEGREMISPEKLQMESFDIKKMILEGTEWTLDLINEVAKENSLDIKNPRDLNKLEVICERAEIVIQGGKEKILISEKKTGAGSNIENYEIELPSTEAGITNLVLIQSQ